MPFEYSPSDASVFVAGNGLLPVAGGPISVSYGRSISKLRDYLLWKEPPYGVIVHAGADEVLVWYDLSNRLHVIQVTGEPIAQDVPKAPYESPDGGFVQNLMARLNSLAGGLPSAREALYGALLIGGMALVLSLRKR